MLVVLTRVSDLDKFDVFESSLKSTIHRQLDQFKATILHDLSKKIKQLNALIKQENKTVFLFFKNDTYEAYSQFLGLLKSFKAVIQDPFISCFPPCLEVQEKYLSNFNVHVQAIKNLRKHCEAYIKFYNTYHTAPEPMLNWRRNND